MKNLIVLLGFFLCITNYGYSQKSFSDYSYIIVSEQFKFQKERDKYQLNSLTKFLFNKYGFHAYFEREVPRYLDPCDGLWAESEGSPGFIITVIEVVIKDCNGVELFRSDKGRSKVKDYKKAYYEATREAFKSVRDLHVTQKEISANENEKPVEHVELNIEKPSKVISTPVVVNEVVETTFNENTSNVNEMDPLKNVPSAKFSNYSYNGITFLLRKTKQGYSVYKETNESDDGLLLIGKIVVSAAEINFIDLRNNKVNAYFDSSKSLIIKKGDTPIICKLVD